MVENAKTKKRGTVHNLASSTVYITGGNITSTATNGIALTNFGTATIGDDDGTIVVSTPVLRGVTTGVNNTGGTLNFYDGIIKGTSDTIIGNTPNEPNNTHEVTPNEVIGGTTYHTVYLADD